MGFEIGVLSQLLITPTKNSQCFPQALQIIHSVVARKAHRAQWPKLKIWLEKKFVSEIELVLTDCMYCCVN